MTYDDIQRRYAGKNRVSIGIVVCAVFGSVTAFFVGHFILALLGIVEDELGFSVISLAVGLVFGGLPTLIGALLVRSGMRGLGRPSPHLRIGRATKKKPAGARPRG